MASPIITTLQRREALQPSSVDTDARTVEVIWTTGAKVARVRWEDWEPIVFDEELLVTDAAVDLTRSNAGAPVLLDHNATTKSQVAVVERAWITGGKGFASVRFPTAGTDAEADRVFGMVRDGIFKNLSVGYRISEVKTFPPKKDGERERQLIERWEPFEISWVAVPADAGAQVRSSVVGGAAVGARARMRMGAR